MKRTVAPRTQSDLNLWFSGLYNLISQQDYLTGDRSPNAGGGDMV